MTGFFGLILDGLGEQMALAYKKVLWHKFERKAIRQHELFRLQVIPWLLQ